MKDQASTLRFIASNSPSLGIFEAENQTETERAANRKIRYAAITSGKGGVGKSNLSVNLALELGALDRKITLLDADFGLANIDLLLNISPQFHLGHVVKGLKDLSDITMNITDNVKLIPSGSGFVDLANITFAVHSYLFTKLRAMEKDQDYILIDTAAGIAENVAGVVISADEVIVVVTPEPTSIVDAYATIKLILRYSPKKQISIVVNSVVGVGDAERVFIQIQSAVRGFLGREIDFLGMIPHDTTVGEAVREQVPIVEYAPSSPAARAVRMIAKQFHNRKSNESNSAIQPRSFWESLADNLCV